MSTGEPCCKSVDFELPGQVLRRSVDVDDCRGGYIGFRFNGEKKARQLVNKTDSITAQASSTLS